MKYLLMDYVQESGWHELTTAEKQHWKPMSDAPGDQAAEVARRTAEAVARGSYGKLVAHLAARSGDIGAAEDALSEAFISALATWPRTGAPSNPEAWLFVAARRELIARARRRGREERATAAPATFGGRLNSTDTVWAIPDQRLALMFVCAHPAIDASVRAPLILQAVLGLNAATIASAFLASPATMGQRLVRAKQKIKAAGIPFRTPDRDELPTRLESVLAAIYAAFAEGWSDPSGTDAGRRDLATEALYLGQLVSELLPQEPEPLGLCALMLYAESRRRARRDPEGQYVPFAEQDISRWDWKLINAAEALLMRASAFSRVGRYQLESAIQSAHVARRRTGQPNWPAVVELYDALLALSRSPVVAVNRAVAVAQTNGTEIALRSLNEQVAADPRLKNYQPYWAARAELLARTGSTEEAASAYTLAIGLERDSAVRTFLQRRRSGLTP